MIDRPVLHGIGVAAGVAAGRVARMGPRPIVPRTDLEAPADVEMEAVRDALLGVADDLEARATSATDQTAADILSAQSLMATDPSLMAKIEEKIHSGLSGAQAIQESFAEFRGNLESAGGYLGERAADLSDLAERGIARLLRLPIPGPPSPGHPYILVSSDLSPADTAELNANDVLAIVTELGGPTSHTAILARTLNIPAVVACPEAHSLVDGQEIMVDGFAGTITFSPTQAAISQAVRRESARQATVAAFEGPGLTQDGHPVNLLLNLGSEADLSELIDTDSEGVGLFRTEFLYLNQPRPPSLIEQQAIYERILRACRDQHIVIRTLDAGSDKPLAFATKIDEPNPALGVRGIRTARHATELLDTQLAALAAAAQETGISPWVMAPMVTTASEAAEFADRAHSAGLEMAGVMIEVPAAALRAADILAGCDFVSIGTNDLAQYTFAADRTSPDLIDLLDHWQPALLDLIRTTANAGQERKKPVGVCGEAAADPDFALVLAGLGINSLSMAASAIPAVRAALATHTLAECQNMAHAALHGNARQR